MAIGRQLGTFELEATSFSLAKAKGDMLDTHLNFEGEMTGEVAGQILVSMTISSADGKDGTYETCGRYFLDDGTVIDAFTQGKTTSLGNHRWRVAGVGKTSRGASIAIKGEIDIKKHSYSGQVHERT